MKDNINNKVHFPFAVKLGLAICLLAVLSTGGSAYYIFEQAKGLVLEGIQNRLKDIGRAGAYLFDEQRREDLKYLSNQVNRYSAFKATDEQANALNGEDGEALTDDDGTYEALSAKLSSKLMNSPEFQRVNQALRKIREGTRQAVHPLKYIPALDVIFKTSEDIPTMAYIYMLLPVKGFSTEKYLYYLADSDYLPVDDDGSGEPYEGNPIGNVTLTLTPEMGQGFTGKAVVEQEFTEDQWGDVVISGYIPILDKNGKVICVLGMDYNVKSEANKIAVLGRVCLTIVAVIFIVSIALAVFLSSWFNRPIAILQEGAERVARRDFSARVEVPSKDEFNNLANAFNTMVGEIDNYATNLQELNVAFERFVPQEFLRHMGKSNIVNVQLGDQSEQEMTVMFSDIRSFTTLSEKMNPKENFDFLNRYLSYVSPLIRSYNGFIDKFIGDAIMALFANEPSDAVQNAIDMIQHLGEFNRNEQETGGSAIKIGVGLHTGRLMLGTIGEERRMESTVIADAVNLASRLEGLTKRFGVDILISEEVAQKASETDNDFLFRSLGKVRIKGKTSFLNVIEVFNGDSPEQIELKNKTMDTFQEGVEKFKMANLSEAVNSFSEVLRINPDDKPARVYYDRCNTNAKTN